jgi:hypothetical protein
MKIFKQQQLYEDTQILATEWKYSNFSKQQAHLIDGNQIVTTKDLV